MWMERRRRAVALLAVSSSLVWASPISYRELRYTSSGVADAAKDRELLEAFAVAVAQNASHRKVRISALEEQLATPVPRGRVEPKRQALTRELEQLKKLEHDAPSGEPHPIGEQVTALVDSVLVGADDGRLKSAEVLGHFTALTLWAEREERVIGELKALAQLAGGNVVVISFQHAGEGQGSCVGAVGVVLRAPSFDPKAVTHGRLPSEI